MLVWQAYLRPAVTLALVLVVSVTSLQQRLLGTATTGDLSNHRAACAGDDLCSQPTLNQESYSRFPSHDNWFILLPCPSSNVTTSSQYAFRHSM